MAQRLVRSTEAGRSSAEPESKLFRDSRLHQDFSHIPVYGTAQPMLQPKLKIGAVGDRYEQEADRVATQVVKRISTPQVPVIQRQTTIEDKDEDLVQKAVRVQSQFRLLIAA
jgi:hypothetical protein